MASWRRIERTQTIMAIIVSTLTLLGALVSLLGLFGVPTPKQIVGKITENSSPQRDASPTTPPSASSSRKVAVPSANSPSSTSAASPSPTSTGLLINLSIESVYSRGKNKAAACNEAELFCIAVDNVVSNDDGEVQSGCHLSWQLHSSASPNLLDKGSILYCGVDPLFVGNKIPMPVGSYRLDVHVELDDGTTAAATYRFSLVD